MVDFPANGHTTSGYLATPPSGTGPGLIVVQEWWGLVDHIKGIVERFAKEGFVAIAPDLYHGESTRSPDEAGKKLMALNIAQAGREMRGAAEYLLAQPSVSPKKVGIVGFCMGGQLALYAGMEHPDKIAAVVDFYGVHPNVEIDPKKVRVPVLAHFAEHDTHTPTDEARALADRINSAGGQVEAHFYDAQHAFFNDSRSEVYNHGAAELAWQRTLEFLRKELS
jgi:carboxymethylenebutenolidase